MPQEEDRAPAKKAVDIGELSDLCTPWCIHVAATLRIAEHIDAGIDKIDELAAAARCDPAVLHAMLGHLVSKGVFEEPEQGRFTLNEASKALLDPTQRIGLDLEGIGGRMAYAWTTLLSFVRTGVPGYSQIFGRPFWEDLDANPAVAESFDALIGPTGHGFPDPDFPISTGWDQVQAVVDVGGGTGAMLAGILRARPWVQGILVDLPRTVARSAEIFQAAGVSDRVTVRGQSFFHELPRGADIYLLRGVLNDWPDAEAIAILKRCAEAARPDGRVVVLKSVGPDGGSRRLVIEMVLVGGKHRSVAEFSELARQSGLEVITAERLPSGMFVVECRPYGRV